MTSGEQAWLYLVSGGASGLVRLGVASDPRQRVRALQVGSPLELVLAETWPYPNRLDAEAIVEALQRRFAESRVRGQWYRLGVVEVRSALANPAIRAAPAAAAAARAAAVAQLAERQARLRRRRGPDSRARTEKELEYQRRRRGARQAKQRRAARLLADHWRQTEAAAAVGVTARTLRNWKHDPGFERALARERARAGQQTAVALPTTPGRVRRRERKLELPPAPAAPEPTGGSNPEPEQPDPEATQAFAEIEGRRLDSHQAWLHSNQARRGELTPTQTHAREQKQRDRGEGGRIKPIIRW